MTVLEWLGKKLCNRDRHKWNVIGRKIYNNMLHVDVECTRCGEKRKLKKLL